MKEGREALHDDKDRNGKRKPSSKHQSKERYAHSTFKVEYLRDCHRPEYFGQLSVGERKSPQSEVGSGIGDASKAELNSMNDLVHGNLPEVEFFLLYAVWWVS